MVEMFCGLQCHGKALLASVISNVVCEIHLNPSLNSAENSAGMEDKVILWQHSGAGLCCCGHINALNRNWEGLAAIAYKLFPGCLASHFTALCAVTAGLHGTESTAACSDTGRRWCPLSVQLFLTVDPYIF